MPPTLKNFDKVIANIQTLKSNAVKRLRRTSEELTEYMYNELMKDIAVEDGHTLKELKKMGHPYGFKGGEYQSLETGVTSRNKEISRESLPHAEPIIHKQGGRLASNVKKITFISSTKIIMRTYVDEKSVPYIKWLVHGSTKMVARPVFIYTWQRIRKECLTRLKYGLNKSLSTKK